MAQDWEGFEISAAILEQIVLEFLEVRDSGVCNMTRQSCVLRAAQRMDLPALAHWIENYSYSTLLDAVAAYLETRS